MERAKHRARIAYGTFGRGIWRKRWRLFVNWWIDIHTSAWYVLPSSTNAELGSSC